MTKLHNEFQEARQHGEKLMERALTIAIDQTEAIFAATEDRTPGMTTFTLDGATAFKVIEQHIGRKLTVDESRGFIGVILGELQAEGQLSICLAWEMGHSIYHLLLEKETRA